MAPPLLLAAVAMATACPPEGTTRAALLELKAARFEVASDAERNRLAPALLGCLDDPDPAIRDGVVFEGLSTWLRGGKLAPATVLVSAFVYFVYPHPTFASANKS